MDLLHPKRLVSAPKLPSYVALDMAFGVGAGASLFDKSRYRSHGTISGAAWAIGVHGYCLDFDKDIPSYVEIDSSYDHLDFTTEDFSIIVRAKFDALTAYDKIVTRGRVAVDGWGFQVDSNGLPIFFTNQAGATKYTWGTNGDIVTGSWYTLGVSRDGTVVTLYKNGVDISVYQESMTDPITCSRDLLLGIDYDKVSNPFDGKIEFLRIIKGIAIPASTHLAFHNALK